jgi:hypothetical protein
MQENEFANNIILEFMKTSNKTRLSEQLGVTRQSIHNWIKYPKKTPQHIKLALKTLVIKEILK